MCVCIICTIKQQIVWLIVCESSSLRWDQTDADVCAQCFLVLLFWGKFSGDHFIHKSRNNDQRLVKNNCLLISTFPFFLVAPFGLPPVPFCVRIQSLFFFALLSFHGKAVEESWSQRGHERESVSGCVRVLHTKTRPAALLLHFTCLESPWILFSEDWLFFPTSPSNLTSVAHDQFSPRAITSFFCCAS